MGSNRSTPAQSSEKMPSDTGLVSTETWTHRHLARKKQFFSRTITGETGSIFRPGSKSLTSHGGVIFSFGLTRRSVIYVSEHYVLLASLHFRFPLPASSCFNSVVFNK